MWHQISSCRVFSHVYQYIIYTQLPLPVTHSSINRWPIILPWQPMGIIYHCIAGSAVRTMNQLNWVQTYTPPVTHICGNWSTTSPYKGLYPLISINYFSDFTFFCLIKYQRDSYIQVKKIGSIHHTHNYIPYTIVRLLVHLMYLQLHIKFQLVVQSVGDGHGS